MMEHITFQTIGLIWITAGIVLIILEVFVPGGFVIFIGISAVIVGVLSYLEVVENIKIQFVLWSLVSFVLILLFRSQVHKWFPALERYKPTTDHTEIIGEEVEVINTVSSDTEEGRVRFQGTTWKAKSKEETIPAGEKAKVVGIKNITLIVGR
jgi:membrane protein implicated in regulation of membrane protease activity